MACTEQPRRLYFRTFSTPLPTFNSTSAGHKMKFLSKSAALGIVALFVPSLAHAACFVNGTAGTPGIVNTIGMEVTGRTPCAVSHWTWSLNTPSAGTFPQKQLKISSQPRHGKVEIVGSQLIYKPDRGFRGEDHFVYVSNNSARNDPNLTFRVNVAVN